MATATVGPRGKVVAAPSAAAVGPWPGVDRAMGAIAVAGPGAGIDWAAFGEGAAGGGAPWAGPRSRAPPQNHPGISLYCLLFGPDGSHVTVCEFLP